MDCEWDRKSSKCESTTSEPTQEPTDNPTYRPTPDTTATPTSDPIVETTADPSPAPTTTVNYIGSFGDEDDEKDSAYWPDNGGGDVQINIHLGGGDQDRGDDYDKEYY